MRRASCAAAIVSAVVLLLPEGAHPAPDDTKFCASLDETTAMAAPECVRWYFACNLGASNAKPPFDRLKALSTFRTVEMKCEHFSYVEAWAALQAHLQTVQLPLLHIDTNGQKN